MKFAAFALPMLGLSAAAQRVSLKARQVETVLSTLSTIQTITGDLDTAISAFTGGDAKPIIDGSHKLIAATTEGAATINALAPISLNDAVKVQTVVKSLQAQVEKTINDLVGKKDTASKASLGGITYDQLTQQLTGADAISKAITAKVPENLKAVAQQLSKGILAAVQKGIDAYADIKDQKAPAGLDTGSASTGAGAGAAAGGAAVAGSNSTMPMTTGPGARVTNAAASVTSAAGSAVASATTTAGAVANYKPVGAIAAMAIAALAL